MPDGSALGSLTPLVMLGVLMLVSRLLWGRHKRHQAPDYGLLVPVAELAGLVDAEAARSRLQAAGVRATLGRTQAVTYVSAQGMAVTRPAGHSVLVFPRDVDAARTALAA